MIYSKIDIQSLRNPEKIITGYLLWEESDSFGFEFKIQGTNATMTCELSKWKILKRYRD